MANYRVTLTEEVWHQIDIEAASKHEAEQKAWAILNSGNGDFTITGREFIDNASVLTEFEDFE